MSKCEIKATSADVFVIHEGVRIAKRGRPGTKYAGTWVALEPGWRVLDGKIREDGRRELIVEREGVVVQ